MEGQAVFKRKQTMSDMNMIKKFVDDIEPINESPTKITFGLDWDGTVTCDPTMWLLICMLMRKRGHKVYIVTMRFPSECQDIPQIFLDNVDGIYPTSRMPKQEHMLKHDIMVHVWIDDNPKAVYQNALQIWGASSPEGQIVIEKHENTN